MIFTVALKASVILAVSLLLLRFSKAATARQRSGLLVTILAGTLLLPAVELISPSWQAGFWSRGRATEQTGRAVGTGRGCGKSWRRVIIGGWGWPRFNAPG